ncbi:MAG: hypothetical protein ACYDEX_01510 [Mobilitalea sp.]
MNISCSKPRVSSYNFMRFLFATLAKNKNVIIDLTKIVDHIYCFKQDINTDLQFLFEDIEFRASVNNVVSYDISEGINNLQTFGIIGKLNPNYEKIVIYLTEQDANLILQDCDTKVKNAMIQLASTF